VSCAKSIACSGGMKLKIVCFISLNTLTAGLQIYRTWISA